MFTFNYAFSRSRLFFGGNHKLSSKKSEESKQETVKRIGRRERPKSCTL